jgi:hypothetical protein
MGTPKDYRAAGAGILIAAGIFILLLANQPTPRILNEKPLLMRINTDKTVYHIGETIWFRHEFYNPNPFPVTFLPPRQITLMEGFIDEEKHPFSYTVPYTEQKEGETITIPPYGAYYPLEYIGGFGHNRIGFFEISSVDAFMQVKVIP